MIVWLFHDVHRTRFWQKVVEMNLKSVLVSFFVFIGLSAASIVNLNLDLYLAIKAYFAEDDTMRPSPSLEKLPKKDDPWHLTEEYCFLYKGDSLRKCLLAMRHFYYLVNLQGEISEIKTPKINVVFNSPRSIPESYTNISDVLEGTFAPQVISAMDEIAHTVGEIFAKLEPTRIFSFRPEKINESQKSDSKIKEVLLRSLKKNQVKLSSINAENAASTPLLPKNIEGSHRDPTTGKSTIQEKDDYSERLNKKESTSQSTLTKTDNSNDKKQTLVPFPGDEKFFLAHSKNLQMFEMLEKRNLNIWDYHKRFSQTLNEMIFALQLIATPARENHSVLYNHISVVVSGVNTVINSLQLSNFFSEPSKDVKPWLKKFGIKLYEWARKNNGDKIPGFLAAIKIIIGFELVEKLGTQVHGKADEWLIALESSPLPEFRKLSDNISLMFMMALYFRSADFCNKEDYKPIKIMQDYEKAYKEQNLDLLLEVKRRASGLVEYANAHFTKIFPKNK